MMGIDDKLAVLKLVSMVKGESISMLVALSNIRNKKAITPNIAVDKCPNKKLKCSFGLIIMVIKEEIVIDRAQQEPMTNPKPRAVISGASLFPYIHSAVQPNVAIPV